MKIKGRTFIISGGCSGLGLSTAAYLLFQGANVSLLDIQPPPPEPPAYASVRVPDEYFKLLSDPSRTLFTKTDVTSSRSIGDAVSATVEWANSTSRPLGGVICCAGISQPALILPRQPDRPTNSTAPPAPKLMPMEPFDRVIAINLRGTVDLIRQTVPHLASLSDEKLQDEVDDELAALDEERGVVVVVSSLAAYEGQIGQLSYSASKGAVASLVLPLARELGTKAGVRVVGIAPGLFESGMTFPPRKSGAKQKQQKPKQTDDEEKEEGGGRSRSMNPGMIEYPTRLGRGEEFARLVGTIIENAMINGSVIRLDGAVRMPSRL